MAAPGWLQPGTKLRPCSKCGAEEAREGQRWCRSCHAAYMRLRRTREITVSSDLAGVTVRVTVSRMVAWRVWALKGLLRLAAWVSGAKVTLVLKGE